MGSTPLMAEGGEALVTEVIQDSVDERAEFIVDLTDVPEGTGLPIDAREARRQARRSVLDDIDDSVQQTTKEALGPGSAAEEQDNSPRPSGRGSDEEERRQAVDRKRKGKNAVTSSTKRAKGKAVATSLPPPAKVPYAAESDSPSGSSDSEEEPDEELNFVPKDVWLTNDLLNAMRKFSDPRRAATFKERSAQGKLAKSGKRYDPAELKEIASDAEFREYIDAIGFDWLLKHSTFEVPTAAAREFFSTFRLKSTHDLDADAITFRLFNEEHEMSIREWTLRMGLMSRTQDDEGLWNDRVVGPPKLTPGFRPQSAWEFITHPNVGQFKTSVSKASHISNQILRFAQTFISYNLMGTASAALTTPDLYFTWCMAKGIRVHLGYWLAQACHQMAANPSRHMYTCHLLGAYLQRNVILKIAKSCREVEMCMPPEVFNVDYFFNKGLLYMSGKETCFYEVGGSDVQVKQEAASVEAGSRIEVEEMRTEVGWMRSEIKMVREEIVALWGKGRDSVEIERVRKEVTGVRTEVDETRLEVRKLREEVVTLTGRISDLVTTTTRHTERMAEGVSLMMVIAKWL